MRRRPSCSRGGLGKEPSDAGGDGITGYYTLSALPASWVLLVHCIKKRREINHTMSHVEF